MSDSDSRLMSDPRDGYVYIVRDDTTGAANKVCVRDVLICRDGNWTPACCPSSDGDSFGCCNTACLAFSFARYRVSCTHYGWSKRVATLDGTPILGPTDPDIYLPDTIDDDNDDDDAADADADDDDDDDDNDNDNDSANDTEEVDHV